MKRLDFALRAVHVHHGIRGAEADRMRFLCETFANVFLYRFLWHTVRFRHTQRSMVFQRRQAGRILRYRILEEEAEKWEQELSGGGQVKIALAHHRDDNAETILHHLLRGSGLTGLAGTVRCRDGAFVRFSVWGGMR